MINAYATLTDLKNWRRSGGTDLVADTTDDIVMSDLLEGASRFIDEQACRHFYPTIETRSFDLPGDRELWFDDDLLELTTLTNGDDTTIASSEYILQPTNYYPKYALKLRQASSIVWLYDDDGNTEQVLDVLGFWGYHDQYSKRAWHLGGTLGAAMADTTTLTLTMTAGHTLAAGNIIKIDSELLIVSSIDANTITAVARGDNGSTAATHLINAPVYIWQPMQTVWQATLEIANQAYGRRHGTNQGGVAQVTAAGVVITPQDVPATAARTIKNLRWVV